MKRKAIYISISILVILLLIFIIGYIYNKSVSSKYIENIDKNLFEVDENLNLTACYFNGSEKELHIPYGIKGIKQEYRLFPFLHDDTVIEKIYIPASMKNNVNDIFQKSHAKNCIVDDKNSEYSDVDGVLFNKKQDKLITYPTLNERIKYTIPNTVEIIEMNAFAGSKYLEEIIIPDSVKEIRPNAFFSIYSINEITIPSSVELISPQAFFLSDIQTIHFNFGLKKIGGYAFAGNRKIEEIKLPNSVEMIYHNAFGDCPNLKRIYLPKSITHFDGDIFYVNSPNENKINIDNLTIYVEKDSEAEKYCKDKGYKFEYYVSE